VDGDIEGDVLPERNINPLIKMMTETLQNTLKKLTYFI
jgi:hypothetical protein